MPTEDEVPVKMQKKYGTQVPRKLNTKVWLLGEGEVLTWAGVGGSTSCNRSPTVAAVPSAWYRVTLQQRM